GPRQRIPKNLHDVLMWASLDLLLHMKHEAHELSGITRGWLAAIWLARLKHLRCPPKEDPQGLHDELWSQGVNPCVALVAFACPLFPLRVMKADIRTYDRHRHAGFLPLSGGKQ